MGEWRMRGIAAPVVAALALATAASVVGCGGDRSIVGEWSGEDIDGNRMTFVFREGGDADWIVTPRDAPPESIGMRYEADLSTTPGHIDLSDFEGGPLEGLTLVGIYEFTDGDRFRMDLEPVVGAVDPDSARPREFSDQAVVFTREGDAE